MKKIMMTMVALLTMTAAVAQNSDNQSERREFKKPTPEQMTEFMTKGLELNDKQKKEVLELNKEYEGVVGMPMMRHRGPRPEAAPDAANKGDKKADRKPRADRRQRPEMTEEQKADMAKRMEKRKEYDEKLKKILSDDQYEKYKKMQRGGHRGQGHRGRGQRGMRPETSMTE